MIMSSPVSMPESMTFEDAITQTQSLLSQIEQDELSTLEIQAAITQLVSTQNGARGFFVTYLTDSRSFADHPSEAIIQALQSSPEIVSELLVKNLAMSAAMEVYHQRHQDPENAAGSARVCHRSTQLLQRLPISTLSSRLQAMYTSVTTEAGDYQSFLERWGYDSEQRQAIQAAIQPLLKKF